MGEQSGGKLCGEGAGSIARGYDNYARYRDRRTDTSTVENADTDERSPPAGTEERPGSLPAGYDSTTGVWHADPLRTASLVTGRIA